MKSKNTKKNSATKSKFGCDFCGRSFAKESTIDKHICEYKRRWGDKNLKGNRIGFQCMAKLLCSKHFQQETKNIFGLY